jgi:type IV pilus assembly protein PilM
VFPLRPGDDEPTFEDDDVQPEFDPGIVDRLSAYTPGTRPEPVDWPSGHEANDDGVQPVGLGPGSPFSFSFSESPDRAVETGHAAGAAAMAEAEPDEPGEAKVAPGSYESPLPEELPEPAVFETRQPEEEEGPGETVSILLSENAGEDVRTSLDPEREEERDEEELSAVFEAVRSELDYESEPEFESIPSFVYTVAEVGDDEAESPAGDGEDADVPEAAPFEAQLARDREGAVVRDELPESALLEALDPLGAPQEVSADARSEPELPVAELPEPELPVAEAPVAEVFEEDEPQEADAVVDDVPAAEVASGEGAGVVEPVELAAPGRRSFRRRRSAGAEEKAGKRKERTPKPKRARKEKRGSKDRKAKRLVGLKIGASQIAAAQVVNNGAPELVEVFREPLEPGLVVSGEIRDPEALGVALKRLFELHKLPKRGVRLGLSNNRIGVRIFEIEGVDDAQQLDNAIRFRAEEVLPIPLDQAVLDYVVLQEDVREDGTPWKRILLVVAYREVVDRYLQACRSAGLEVVGIDLEAFALLRAVEAPMDRGHHAGALVAVAIGHDRSTIAVSTGRHCEFARVLDWGGWSLNVAIARELDRAPSEVEAVKRQLSFSTATEVDGLTIEQTAKAREAIQRSLAGFVRELVASLQFYQAQPGALGIGEVVLTGGTAHMDGLPEALGAQIGVPIRVGDPFKRVKVGPKVAHEGPRGSLSVAIGLGIED